MASGGWPLSPRPAGAGSRRDCRRRRPGTGQLDREATPLPHPALSGDPPAVRFGQVFHDGQSEPGTGAGSILPAVKPLEHVRQVFGRDAGAGVPDRQQRALLMGPQFQAHGAAGRGVPERVVDEVAKDLVKAARIGQDLDLGSANTSMCWPLVWRWAMRAAW